MNALKKTCFLCILLVSATSAITQTFRISGTTSGIVDGTWLYLRTASPEKMLDSAKVQNGKFRLSGKRDEKAQMVIIFTSRYSNYVRFWAEENVRIHLNEGEFKKAVIIGSKTQSENERLLILKVPLDKKEDSLSRLYQTEKDSVRKKILQDKIRIARTENQNFDIEYIKSNSKSLVSAYLLDIYAPILGKEKTVALYQNLSPEIKQTSFAKHISNFIELNKDIQVGNKFSDFEQVNSNGNKVKLSSVKGKYTLLEFWASWCGPCRKENPSLVATYNIFKDKGFVIFGVSADENKAFWLEAIKEDKLPWENVSDLRGDKNEAAVIYGITAYPSNYLIDEDGVIIAKDLRGDKLKKKLEELLP
ncbi:redoxin domain-containing protein [Flavitalea sp.]|nr:TlpA disulfide reductase family protein [Flavitalea sp.]